MFRCLVVIAAAVLMLAGVGGVPASASGGGGVEGRGTCSKGSEWRLDADPQGGRIRVEAEVDTHVDGQHWTWRLLHDGGVSARGHAVTQDGGSYKVQRTMVDVAGVDSIGWRSTDAATGEHCAGNVKY
jgi:hypothetical protein